MSNDADATPADLWRDLRYFIGRWRGAGSDKIGESQAERDYRFVLNKHFIQLTGRSVFQPQKRSPAGEVHEEISYLSYDKNRQRNISREFHVEWYVNQYVLENRDTGNRPFVFVTEAIENISPGRRARTPCEILGENRFRETFDLARQEQEWPCFIDNVFERA